MNRFPLMTCLLIFISYCIASPAQDQISPKVKNIFPASTIVYGNIPYAGDTILKHQLDIYLPPGKMGKLPLVVWIHGGAWMMNDKYADMGYMKKTVAGFIDSGYALASINYRYSTDAVFPAQIQDGNQALEWLYQHADQYHIDRDRIALIGFSAGGHLANLLGLARNNDVTSFYLSTGRPHFSIRCVLDFYGPSDLIMLANNPDTSVNNMRNPVSILLGAMAVNRPDLAKRASPATYIDKNDPPFLIVQGEKDESVPNTQSKILSAWLTLSGVPNELIVVPDAPHYGVMFDADWIRVKLFSFLKTHLKN